MINYFDAAENTLRSRSMLEKALKNLMRRQERIMRHNAPSGYPSLDTSKPYTSTKSVNDALTDCIEIAEVAREINRTKEKIDEEYPRIIEDLKYQLIKENLVKENGLKVEDADIEGFAKRVAKAQFAQYGMLSVPKDVLANYAKDILKNKQTLQNIIDRAVEEKLAGWLKEQVELDIKEVTADEFNKLFEE